MIQNINRLMKLESNTLNCVDVLLPPESPLLYQLISESSQWPPLLIHE